MNPKNRTLAIITLCAAGFAPVPAEAQSFGVASARPAPLYPYELQPGQSYAVEIAPHTYVIHRPRQGRAQNYPYVGCVEGCGHPEPHRSQAAPAPRRFDHPPRHNDPALIDEPHKRAAKKKTSHEVVQTTKLVRDPPVVIEHRRVVDDPPRVIERHHYVEDAPTPAYAEKTPAPPVRKTRIAEHSPALPSAKTITYQDEGRVIHAEAEVTILGPDRMSIRVFRKRGTEANARAIEPH